MRVTIKPPTLFLLASQSVQLSLQAYIFAIFFASIKSALKKNDIDYRVSLFQIYQSELIIKLASHLFLSHPLIFK